MVLWSRLVHSLNLAHFFLLKIREEENDAVEAGKKDIWERYYGDLWGPEWHREEQRRINVDFSLAQQGLGVSGEMGIKSKGIISLCRPWLGWEWPNTFLGKISSGSCLILRMIQPQKTSGNPIPGSDLPKFQRQESGTSCCCSSAGRNVKPQFPNCNLALLTGKSIREEEISTVLPKLALFWVLGFSFPSKH